MTLKAELARLREWCRDQRDAASEYELRLVEGAPLSPTEIEAIPSYPSSFPYGIPDAYDPASFVVPQSYKDLLSVVGGLRLEFRCRAEEQAQPRHWQVYPLLNVFRPGSCSRAHLNGAPPGLCDSWTASGGTLDDRELSTTRFLSFATAGDTVELSRWCFFLEGTDEPTIYFEVNEYECDLGHWVDTGEWIDAAHSNYIFRCFADWFAAVINEICSAPFDPEANEEHLDAILNS